MIAVNSIAFAAITSVVFFSFGTAFDASANTNMAVYWGQGDSQPRLAHFCEDSSIDIIPIGFLNVFPDQTGGYPGTNFANACGDATYKNEDGSNSTLLSDCPLIGPDIVTCQKAGKKILLSLGGAVPTNQEIKSDASAVQFAEFLWKAFGPIDPAYSGPRPFGDAVVDGFDFDIESSLSKVSGPSALSRGYATIIKTLRSFYALETKTYYISSAPQCVVPDAHLADAIEKSYFDFIFVQFYNTPECSARAFFDHTYGSYGGPPTDISFKEWVDFIISSSKNPNAKVYLGLPSSPLKTYDAKMYIQPSEVSQLISKFQCDYPNNFGGLMVFEATSSEANSIEGKPYVDVLKSELMQSNCANQPATTPALPGPTPSPSSSSSSSTLSSQSSTSTFSQNSTSTSNKSSNPVSAASSFPESTSSSTIASASFSMPSYTSGTGVWNSTTTVGPTAPFEPSGSAPYTRPSRKHNSTSTTKIYGTGASVPVSFFPTGASGGFSRIASPTSNAPYPTSNNLTAQSTATGGIVYTTETIRVTTCGPEVKSCPARLSTTCYPVTTSTQGPVTGTSAGASGTSSSAAALGSGASPKQSSSATLEAVTTEIIYTTLTTCPVTNTVTSSGQPITQTSSTVSTIYSTSTSTICTRCVAPPTTASASTGIGATSTTSTPATASTLSTAAPVSSAPATTQAVVTTEIVFTTLTTCPVTSTLTSGGRTITQTSSTVSTIYSTSTSTICTKCISPAPTGTPAASTASAPATASTVPGAAPVSSSPATTQALVMTEIVYTTLTTCPVTRTLTSSGSQIVQTTQTVSTVISTSISTICTKCVVPTTRAPLSAGTETSILRQGPFSASSAPSSAPSQSSSSSGNSPVGISNSPSSPSLEGSQITSVTSTVTVAASSPASSSVSASSSGASSSTASVIIMTVSPVPLNPSQTAKPQSSAQTASGTAAIASVSANSGSASLVASVSANNPVSAASGTAPVASISAVSPSSPTIAGSSSSNAPVSTLVVVPVPLSPSQTARPAQSSQGVQAISAAPFPSGNATSPVGTSAQASAISVGVPSASSKSTLAANPAQFTGAASKMHVRVTGMATILAAAAFLL